MNPVARPGSADLPLRIGAAEAVDGSRKGWIIYIYVYCIYFCLFYFKVVVGR